MLLNDHETKVDLLNNEAIATSIISLLRAKPHQPVTIGVHGDWGAGKSSVLEMIEAGFAHHGDTLCLKFNGWRFQGFEDAKIALIEGIVTGLIEKRSLTTKAADVVKDAFKRIDCLKVAKRVGGLALTALTGIPSPDLVQAAVGTLQGFVSDPSKAFTKENVAGAIEELQGVLKPGESKNLPQEVEAFRKAFDKLLEKAGISQLVVLIDDLDRCLPDTAIETLEAIRLFVFTSRTAFVVAADEAMIEYAVRKHFPDLPETTGPRDYARNYLEKLIQVPFRIPSLGETETRIYVTLLLTGREFKEGNENYARLMDVAREKLKKPWIHGGLDVAAVRKALGTEADKANEALLLSDQICPILATGTKGNPRQIKRFLNTLLLREHAAQARGFGEDIKLPVLAKLMLAERFLQKVFEQIAFTAAAHANGQSDDLATLERFLSLAEKGKAEAGDAAKGTPAPPATDSPTLTEWKASSEICAWGRLEPKLGGMDMRPYLFVTKDKKNYFGAMSTLGHLAEVVEKLFAPKFTILAYEDKLKELAQIEAETVFESVRTRIMSTGALETRPLGIDGLLAIVKAQPHLQPRLLDFIEALPASKIDAWAVGGWQNAVTDPACLARLKKQLQAWSKEPSNANLRNAAIALSTQKGPG